jgi:aspartate-semialdehyde dehydrogenase
MNRPIDLGVVGATGLVGEAFLQLLEKKNIAVGNVRLFASGKSEGLSRTVGGVSRPIEALKPECFSGLQFVFFSSGEDISREWAPQAVKAGAYAIDNSSAFRMDPDTSLIVPEVNAKTIPLKPAIIANPNCSTIQLVVALNALKKFGLRSVRVASYQAASGAGKLAQAELEEHLKDGPESKNLASAQFPVTLAYNCIPQIGAFDHDGFCSEEVKIQKETKKILDLPKLRVSAFTVRVPVWNSHSEAAWIELDKEVSRDEVLAALHSQTGLQITDTIGGYPHARASTSAEPVFVGRIHRDIDDSHTWMMWIVADNLWKGAALNGLQIAETIFNR